MTSKQTPATVASYSQSALSIEDTHVPVLFFTQGTCRFQRLGFGFGLRAIIWAVQFLVHITSINVRLLAGSIAGYQAGRHELP